MGEICEEHERFPASTKADKMTKLDSATWSQRPVTDNRENNILFWADALVFEVYRT